MVKSKKWRLDRGQKTLNNTQKNDILLEALNSSDYLSQEVQTLNRPYALATLAKIYEDKGIGSQTYSYIHKLGPDAIGGLLLLYKKDLIKLEDNGETEWFSLTPKGFYLAEKLKETLGGSLELLLKELQEDNS
ncbi:MAG: hypothetical protein AABX61_01275 [Nanoarchaeota archaeon]